MTDGDGADRIDGIGEIDRAELARRFEEHRPYLRRLAYSTLGSLTDADDVVQDAWLRLQRWHENRSEGERIENLLDSKGTNPDQQRRKHTVPSPNPSVFE